ncbi:MAG TPA: ligand-binding protein SH3 [Clostridiales bacterium UBA8960]|jgi:uncharacterized membrane protein|nr:ligand-binding protein SH3 [Clostridiales bacterium UBA8960]
MFNRILEIITIEVIVLLTAALPIIELRGAIPVGVAFGMSPIHAALVSFAGSMLPVPFILFLIRPIFNMMKKTDLFKNLIQKLTHKSDQKSHRIKKYGWIGLLIFVAIPLPGTGVWSGSLAAALLDMRFKTAFPAILVGNMIAAVLIMTVSHGIFNYL